VEAVFAQRMFQLASMSEGVEARKRRGGIVSSRVFLVRAILSLTPPSRVIKAPFLHTGLASNIQHTGLDAPNQSKPLLEVCQNPANHSPPELKHS
jgi:hypothetical protein